MRYLSVITAALFIFFPASGAHAASATGKLYVYATILPAMEYRVIETRNININKADIMKGYKNVENGTILSIFTNDTKGYVLSISSEMISGYGETQHKRISEEHEKGRTEKEEETDGEDIQMKNVYTSVTITFDGNTYTMPAGGSVEIPVLYEGLDRKIKRLGYSFQLEPDAPAGSYRLPIMITPMPL